MTMREYRIMMDDQTATRVEEALGERIGHWENDGSACYVEPMESLQRVADELSRQRLGLDVADDSDQATEAVTVEDGAGGTVELPLVARLMHASHSFDTGIRQQLIDSLQADVDRLEATISLMRGDVEQLYGHSWMPRESHVLAALYPLREDIEQRARSIRQARGL